MIRVALLPFLLLTGYGIAFGASALGTSLLVFDDHPGQLYRVWHVVMHGWAPWAWNSGWWTGYPELQFYPPGFAYAAALLHSVSFSLLTVPVAYQTLVWVTYLLPGLATLVVLTRLLGDGWLALPGAFVAMTLSAGTSGVEGGVHIGMIGARLASAVVVLFTLSLLRWTVEGHRLPSSTTVLLAAVVLTHPAHGPAALALLALGALGGIGAARARWREAAWTLVIAVGLTAFWTVPLLTRLSHTRALAWGTLPAQAVNTITQPLTVALVLLALLGSLGVGHFTVRSPAATMITRWPWLLAILVGIDAVLLEPLGIRWLPSDRILDGVWLAVALAAGWTGGALVARAASRLRTPIPWLSLAAVALAIALSLPGGTLTLWPRAVEWPSYASVVTGMRLHELWSALRNGPPGRVLFVRSGAPLVAGAAWYRPHTHITALTPIMTGRPIVNGTFTHPSPTAAIVYRGSPGPESITGLVEKLDGHSLFGRPLATLDPATFNAYAERLAVSVVVALDDDAPNLGFLAENPVFTRSPALPPFVVYRRRSPTSLPEEASPAHWRVTLSGEPGAWASARVAFYPLWRAESEGRALEIRRGEFADLEVRLDQATMPIDLFYAPGIAERSGAVISVVSVLLCLGRWILNRRLKASQFPQTLTDATGSFGKPPTR